MITTGFTLGCLAVMGPGNISDLPEEVTLRIEQAVQETAPDLNGLVLLVAVGDELMFEHSFGSAGEEGRAPASRESAFRAGALHAQLVPALVMRLVDEGELDLEAGLGTFFPQLENHDEVELRHLLAHTSGLPRLDDLGEVKGDQVRAGLISQLSAAPLYADAGECFHYSATNEVLLGWILEDALESPLQEAFEENVFGPLGLAGTQYCYDGPPLDELIDSYQEVRGDASSRAGVERFSAADGLCTTADDLLALHLAFVGGEVVSANAFQRMTESARLEDGSTTGHGFGFASSALGELERIVYGGGMSGGHVHAAWYPEFGLSIVLLARGDHARLDPLERKVARAVLDLPEPEPSDIPTTAEQRESYLGSYYVGCDRLRIVLENDALVFEGGEWTRTRLLYQGAHVFLGADSNIRIEFDVEDDRAIAFQLTAGGAEARASRGGL